MTSISQITKKILFWSKTLGNTDKPASSTAAPLSFSSFEKQELLRNVVYCIPSN